ncbi:hypothetical protein PMG71_09555 [Roseofilum sp. BLCC_M154]|uniref:DUF732 domain-containing protein n=1 Tax=Roseofilum acuticapitatum BLCC-M154 TaxID=3022444 RepID=A0ABT7ATN6_9CYAN|nr:hypothetical protein [Roseofilum acuticapitatum]MDJ1169671.1 hypothetical protein [Roseofilum acuticapitatum BLCC-M154]
MKLKHILLLAAATGALGIAAWWALKPEPKPAIAYGQALQALASPSEPDPEWLIRSDWILQKFCIDAQGSTIATLDPSPCGGQPFGRGGEDSLNQLLLWAERHRQNAINLEAQRLIAKAIEFANTPNHPCHQKPLDQCYQSFEDNLIGEIQNTNDPAELARLIGKSQALAIARSGISPRTEPLSKTQIQQGIERFSQDLETLKSAGIDGAIQLSRDIQEQLNHEQN